MNIGLAIYGGETPDSTRTGSFRVEVEVNCVVLPDVFQYRLQDKISSVVDDVKSKVSLDDSYLVEVVSLDGKTVELVGLRILLDGAFADYPAFFGDGLTRVRFVQPSKMATSDYVEYEDLGDLVRDETDTKMPFNTAFDVVGYKAVQDRLITIDTANERLIIDPETIRSIGPDESIPSYIDSLFDDDISILPYEKYLIYQAICHKDDIESFQFKFSRYTGFLKKQPSFDEVSAIQRFKYISLDLELFDYYLAFLLVMMDEEHFLETWNDPLFYPNVNPDAIGLLFFGLMLFSWIDVNRTHPHLPNENPFIPHLHPIRSNPSFETWIDLFESPADFDYFIMAFGHFIPDLSATIPRLFRVVYIGIFSRLRTMDQCFFFLSRITDLENELEKASQLQGQYFDRDYGPFPYIIYRKLCGKNKLDKFPSEVQRFVTRQMLSSDGRAFGRLLAFVSTYPTFENCFMAVQLYKELGDSLIHMNMEGLPLNRPFLRENTAEVYETLIPVLRQEPLNSSDYTMMAKYSSGYRNGLFKIAQNVSPMAMTWSNQSLFLFVNGGDVYLPRSRFLKSSSNGFELSLETDLQDAVVSLLSTYHPVLGKKLISVNLNLMAPLILEANPDHIIKLIEASVDKEMWLPILPILPFNQSLVDYYATHHNIVYNEDEPWQSSKQRFNIMKNHIMGTQFGKRFRDYPRYAAQLIDNPTHGDKYALNLVNYGWITVNYILSDGRPLYYRYPRFVLDHDLFSGIDLSLLNGGDVKINTDDDRISFTPDVSNDLTNFFKNNREVIDPDEYDTLYDVYNEWEPFLNGGAAKNVYVGRMDLVNVVDENFGRVWVIVDENQRHFDFNQLYGNTVGSADIYRDDNGGWRIENKTISLTTVRRALTLLKI